MKDLSNLLFELSNEDRLAILFQLEANPMNITNLAKKLDLKIQEVSRHVSRLSKSKLIKKNINGYYQITPNGNLVLDQLPGLDFISDHMNYFSTHSTKFLPLDLRKQFGNLSQGKYVDDVMKVYQNVGNVMREAKDYVLAIVDQDTMKLSFWEPIMSSALPAIKNLVERKVKINFIEPKSWKPSSDNFQVNNEEKRLVSQAMKAGLLEHRDLEKSEVFLYMSEKEVAILGFPTLVEGFDHLGFTSDDEQFRYWCKNLFMYYWEKAKQLSNPII